MSSCPFTSAFHCSFGLNRDAPGYTCTSRSTPAALASRAMICTISSRTSPLPPGNWCAARNTVGAAKTEPEIKAPASAKAIPPRLKWVMDSPPDWSIKNAGRAARRSLAHRRADFRGDSQFAFHARNAVNRSHDAGGVFPLLARIDYPAQAHPAALRVDAKGEAPRGRIGAQGRLDARLQREIGKRAVGLVGFNEVGFPGQLDDFLGALLDAHALGVERQVVALRILPVDAEVALGDRALGLVAVADFGGDRVAVVRIEPLHHALHSQLERRANAHADRVLHRPQQVGGAPAAHHRAFARNLQ